jgi:hypothetical protein
MGSNEFVRNLLIEQRKRLTGTLMKYLEAQVYPTLNPRQRTELRDKVLAAIGAYHDTCLDILKASVDDGSEQNVLAMEFRDLNSNLARLLRQEEESVGDPR